MDEHCPPRDIDQSTHTTRRKSARSAKVEIITHGERRRSWTPEQKREIVVESLGPDLTPTEVARKYAINSGQLYTWRLELLSLQQGALVSRVPPRFAQVELKSAQPVPVTAAPPDGQPLQAVLPTSTGIPGGRLEITLSGGVVLRVDADVDGTALRGMLAVLDLR
jgi:transposase